MTQDLNGAPVIQVITQKGQGDCAIAALAMYLGKSYEDVLAAAVSYTSDYKVHKRGLWLKDIAAVAQSLGFILNKRKKYDLETACGIISLHSKTINDHVAVLKSGMIFDTNGCVWVPEVYLANSGYTKGMLLTQD